MDTIKWKPVSFISSFYWPDLIKKREDNLNNRGYEIKKIVWPPINKDIKISDNKIKDIFDHIKNAIEKDNIAIFMGYQNHIHYRRVIFETLRRKVERHGDKI